MKDVLTMVPLALYSVVGIVSFLMAYKSIFFPKFLPFHEEASGKSWESIEKNLQYVILTLMKVSGLGFLTMGILLVAGSVYLYFSPGIFLRYFIPFISLVYCSGLFLVNFWLFKKTKAKTPWKGSLYSMLILVIALILSII